MHIVEIVPPDIQYGGGGEPAREVAPERGESVPYPGHRRSEIEERVVPACDLALQVVHERRDRGDERGRDGRDRRVERLDRLGRPPRRARDQGPVVGAGRVRDRGVAGEDCSLAGQPPVRREPRHLIESVVLEDAEDEAAPPPAAGLGAAGQAEHRGGSPAEERTPMHVIMGSESRSSEGSPDGRALG